MRHGHSIFETLVLCIGRGFVRTVGVVVGVAMACVGLAMGVTMIMLPVGIVLGLLGVLVITLAISPIRSTDSMPWHA